MPKMLAILEKSKNDKIGKKSGNNIPTLVKKTLESANLPTFY
jgi:hypothetical protein